VARTRITAGEWRGRVIDTPPGMELRPTRSMVRESLFNILRGRITDARVLDLYAGAGTLGFEALSRGATQATFVDRDPAALRLLTATAARLGCQDRCVLVRASVIGWLRHRAAEVGATDVCFVDPPYREVELDRVLEILGLRPPALVVCEHHEKHRLPARIGSLTQVRAVRHGLTTLTFLQRITDGDEPAA
jgi:16S rRNA (guanine966-N2)-methyltransferase